MDNHDCFLTPLQQKFLQILSDYEKDPQSLEIREETDDLEAVTSYFKVLLLEKGRLLKYGQANFAVHLIDEEIGRLFMAPISMADIGILEECGREALRRAELSALSADSEDSMNTDDEEVTLSESVRIPVDTYPTYNFIGRIIGPRGMTAKQLEKDTGCRIMIRGNHSNKTYGNSSQRTTHGDGNNDTIDLPLRVIIETSGPRREATARISEALNVVNSLLIPPPDGRDELKRRQLVELAIMNGTYRPTTSCSKSDHN
uniref:KH domain-containing protein n=1 Tax=Caenorhabditis japonica TaxID=281687 RepID=A0A8R1HYZ8_CAEJA